MPFYPPSSGGFTPPLAVTLGGTGATTFDPNSVPFFDGSILNFDPNFSFNSNLLTAGNILKLIGGSPSNQYLVNGGSTTQWNYNLGPGDIPDDPTRYAWRFEMGDAESSHSDFNKFTMQSNTIAGDPSAWNGSDLFTVLGNGLVIIPQDTLQIKTPNTVGDSTDPGEAGMIRWDSDYVYVATGTNEWKRTPITTW